jgi:serine phosphatase RsbU (regulator of sigma subunit)
MLAGNVLPGYDIGGDWFDYVENEDGAWIGVADAMGHGTTAAALAAVALGAFRAVRHVGAELEEAAAAIDRTMREVQIEGAFVNVILARWNGPTSTVRWIACGGQQPLLMRPDGDVVELDSTHQDALGRGPANRSFATDRKRLAPGERLLLLSDGVLGRRTHAGGDFGLDGVRAAVRGVESEAAAPIVRRLEDAIAAASADPLEDDATIVVFAPSGAQP